MIVANTAKNRLAKKDPMLFSDLNTEEEMEGLEYQIEDENIENQPEIAYTKQEVRELVHELIDALSEEQRICMLMFYIEGASIREIASALDCSENTVKSRLNYGRKNLKAKAEQLQKKGYKLLGVAPLPLLLSLLRMQEAELAASGTAAEAGKEIAAEVFRHASVRNSAVHASHVRHIAEGGAKTAAKAAAKSGFLHTVAGKVVAIVAAACVVGGIVYGTSQMADQSQGAEATVSETAAQETEPEASNSTQPSAAPTVRELTDEECTKLIAGNLSKEELAFVLAYGPEEIPAGGFTIDDYALILNTLCQGAEGNGMIANYGRNAEEKTMYSINDVNRLFSIFTDYRFAENAEHAEMIDVADDAVIFFPATLNYTASADITKTEYTGDEINVYYTYQHNGYDDQYTLYKKAVLAPMQDGTYRIIKIEEVQENSTSNGTPAGGSAASAAPSVTAQDVYAEVLDGSEAGGDLYFLCDMNGDGTKELIVGSEVPEGPFVYYDFCAYSCEAQGNNLALKPIEGRAQAMGPHIAADGNGFYSTLISRGTGDVEISRIIIQDGALVQGGLEKTVMLGSAEYEAFTNENPRAEWLPLTDRSALAALG